MRRWSLAARFAAAMVLIAVIASLATVALTRLTRSPAAGVGCAIALALPIALGLAKRITRPWSRVLRAVGDGIESLRDHDFSVSVGNPHDDELGRLVSAYNSLGGLLRRERLDLYQRELLLDTVIQTTPLATVLTNAAGRIVYGNIAARQLFHDGHKLEGLELTALLVHSPAGLRDALCAQGDRLFTVQMAGEAQVYHLSRRDFLLNAQPHRLMLLKQLTRELAAQEVIVWKKVIRVIAHELNNSLAPISSLAHSGQLLAQQPDSRPLQRVFTTIAERAAHLTSFIEGYAQFAKLPRPRLAAVAWPDFLGRLEDTMGLTLNEPVPRTAGCFDASQMEQVMINLLKNAAESGSPPDAIHVGVREEPDGFVIAVADRGCGLSEDVLRDALLPFFSTKATGTGLGLTLCREIVDAHDGRLSLANRPDGGAMVTVWLPRR